MYFALAISIALVAYLVLAGFSSSMLGTTGFVTGNVSSGQNISGDFVINVTGVNPDNTSFAGSESGTVVTLDPGEYGVDEDYFAGYTKSLSVDCSETVSFGDSKTCTITNDDEPGTLIVKKIIDGGSNVYEALYEQEDPGSDEWGR